MMASLTFALLVVVVVVVVVGHHPSNGRHAGVIVCCRRILSDYPGFLPALDPLIDAAFKNKDYRTAGAALLERLEYAGPTRHTLRQLDRLPEGLLTADHTLRLMELAPERTGRLLLAQGLMGTSQPQ